MSSHNNLKWSKVSKQFVSFIESNPIYIQAQSLKSAHTNDKILLPCQKKINYNELSPLYRKRREREREAERKGETLNQLDLF